VTAHVEVVTRTARIWVDADGIMRHVCTAGSEHALADAEEAVAAYGRIWGGVLRPLVVDLSTVKSIDRAARIHYSTQSFPYVSAVALVVGSPLSRMIGNFFLGLNPSTLPVKLFRSEPQAEAWLRQCFMAGAPGTVAQ